MTILIPVPEVFVIINGSISILKPHVIADIMTFAGEIVVPSVVEIDFYVNLIAWFEGDMILLFNKSNQKYLIPNGSFN